MRKEVYQLKTCFDPLSPEWEKTGYEEKCSMIKLMFKEPYSPRMNAALRMIITATEVYENKEELPTDDEDGIDILDVNIEPLIPFYNLLLATGLYLNKIIDPGFVFPETLTKTTEIFQEVERLKNRQSKKSTSIEKVLSTINPGRRELFDILKNEGKRYSHREKINKLLEIYYHGVSPSEFLFFHVNDSNSSAEEAPYSAFALCWDEKRFGYSNIFCCKDILPKSFMELHAKTVNKLQILFMNNKSDSPAYSQVGSLLVYIKDCLNADSINHFRDKIEYLMNHNDSILMDEKLTAEDWDGALLTLVKNCRTSWIKYRRALKKILKTLPG